ncbi:MAG: hypothetical protein M5Z89_05005 [Olivibacter sp.]|nr:hypothetical protein [Olivibacter sp. UJ_SKK_5.1]
MKKFIILSSLVLFSITRLCAQASVKKIKDPHIRAQQQRMVYQSWGNWLPKAKYFLGVQLNYHHTLTWGWLAPSQNNRYMKGADIRPLGPYGQQTQRMLANAALQATSNTYKAYSDSIARDATSELYNSSGLFSTLDPLWRLYYSKEMDGLLNYDLSAIVSTLSDRQKIYLTKSGGIQWYDDQILMLQEKLNAAFNQDIDRGSRLINYHNLLIDYRKLQAKWMSKIALADKLYPLHEKAQQAQSPPSSGFTWNAASDREIMRAIMQRTKNQSQ